MQIYIATGILVSVEKLTWFSVKTQYSNSTKYHRFLVTTLSLGEVSPSLGT